MPKKIINIVLIFFALCLASINAQPDDITKKSSDKKDSNHFVSLIPSPVIHHISQIKMFRSKLGFASGAYFLEYNGLDWDLSKDTELLRNIICFYAVDEKNIFLAKI